MARNFDVNNVIRAAEAVRVAHKLGTVGHLLRLVAEQGLTPPIVHRHWGSLEEALRPLPKRVVEAACDPEWAKSVVTTIAEDRGRVPALVAALEAAASLAPEAAAALVRKAQSAIEAAPKRPAAGLLVAWAKQGGRVDAKTLKAAEAAMAAWQQSMKARRAAFVAALKGESEEKPEEGKAEQA